MKVTEELSDKMDRRTQVALSILLNILTHEQSKPTFMLDKINELARRAVLLANALLNQLAAGDMLDQLARWDGDKILTEDSRNYWRGRSSELKKSLAALEAEEEARERRAKEAATGRAKEAVTGFGCFIVSIVMMLMFVAAAAFVAALAWKLAS